MKKLIRRPEKSLYAEFNLWYKDILHFISEWKTLLKKKKNSEVIYLYEERALIYQGWEGNEYDSNKIQHKYIKISNHLGSNTTQANHMAYGNK